MLRIKKILVCWLLLITTHHHYFAQDSTKVDTSKATLKFTRVYDYLIKEAEVCFNQNHLHCAINNYKTALKGLEEHFSTRPKTSDYDTKKKFCSDKISECEKLLGNSTAPDFLYNY
ncbi:MAG: hypothetical protein AB1458_16975, partial [Bacteroidota bacterium]